MPICQLTDKSADIKKCCHGYTCFQVCRKANQRKSVQEYGKQVQETEKSVAMATLVASYRLKANQPKSMQGFGM